MQPSLPVIRRFVVLYGPYSFIVRPENQAKAKRIRLLSEKWLKCGQKRIPDKLRDLLQYGERVPVPTSRRVLERYKRGALDMHIHIVWSTVKRLSNDCCAVCHSTADDVDMDTPSIKINRVSEDCREVQRPMFVDICEFRKNPQGMHIAERLPSLIRLQSFNACVCLKGNPVQSTATDLVGKTQTVIADREHIGVARDLAIGDNQLPHEMIKGGSRIMKKVSNDDAGHQVNHRESQNSGCPL